VHLPVFPLREVKVNGELDHVTREQVQLIVKRELKGNFFTVDLDQAKSAFEKLPWIRSASVRRRWPDRLEVAVEEHVALARWGNMALVDTNGALFGAASNEDLPVFIGPSGSEREVAQHYLMFRQALKPIGLAPTQVVLSARRAWELRLNNGLTVELGREQVEPRLAKFVGVYDRTLAVAQHSVRYVDLRYPNGFAVRMPGYRG
jgi:cell division protein FtsQ